jgi:L-asparagine oxygenase
MEYSSASIFFLELIMSLVIQTSQHGVIEIHFSTQLCHSLHTILCGQGPRRYSSSHDWVHHLRQLGYCILPPALLRLIEHVRGGSCSPTAMVLYGLPYDPVTAAPASGETAHHCKAGNLSEALLCMFGALLGEPYGIEAEGGLISNLIPSRDDQTRLTGNGSGLKLGLHVENAAHRVLFPGFNLAPRALLLTGVLAPANGVQTFVANGRTAVARLSPDHQAILRSPCVQIALPLRQRTGGQTRTAVTPVVTGKKGREVVTVAFYGDMTLPISPAAEEALRALEAELEALALGFFVEPGTLLYIPNGYCLHGRDAFAAQFDAQGRANRWLQRLFVAAELEPFSMGLTKSERVFALPT